MENTEPLIIGRGDEFVKLLPNMANRHGLIAGATGTGKTISLKVLAEYFSSICVPVFLSDVKGDLVSLSQEGSLNTFIQDRIETIGLKDFTFEKFPTRLWDVYGESGHPIRTSITEMGPLLLSKLLNLNDVQNGVLNIAFRVADENSWLLLDIKDLRSMLKYLGDNSKEYSLEYGNISTQSIGAIQRSLLRLEDSGGNLFFGEPSLDINDLFANDIDGKGIINILDSQILFQSPQIYSSLLLFLLSELYENLPEVGDLDKPKIVFFFDEAHLLFKDTPKVLLEKIELVVRLIRSKGVSIFFVTQNPKDIPESILSQLGNRVQHALRAYTPKDMEELKKASSSFRPNPNFSTMEAIASLKTGEALVSFLDSKGSPSVVQRTLIRPPKSLIGTISNEKRDAIIANSPMFYKYKDPIDRESAYEIITKKYQELSRDLEAIEKLKKEEEDLKSKEKERLALEKNLAKERRERERARKNNPFNKIAKTTISTLTGDIGRKIARGLLGNVKKMF